MKKRILAIIIAAGICCAMIMPIQANTAPFPKGATARPATIMDVLDILKIIAKMETPTIARAHQLDFDSNNTITIKDALEVLKGMAKMRPMPKVDILPTVPQGACECGRCDDCENRIDFKVFQDMFSLIDYTRNEFACIVRSVEELHSMVEVYSETSDIFNDEFFKEKVVVVFSSVLDKPGKEMIINSLTKKNDSLTINLIIGSAYGNGLIPFSYNLFLVADRKDLEGVSEFKLNYSSFDFSEVCVGRLNQWPKDWLESKKYNYKNF